MRQQQVCNQFALPCRPTVMHVVQCWILYTRWWSKLCRKCIHSLEPLNVSHVKTLFILRFLSSRNDWTCGVLSSSWIHRLQLCTGCCIRDHINNTRRVLYLWLQHQPFGHSTFVSIAEAIVSVHDTFVSTFFFFIVLLECLGELAVDHMLYRPGI